MTSIKICGIKTLLDALAAVDAGADMLGFNFYPKSPRFIDIQSCARISAVLRSDCPTIVLAAVFVNASQAHIEHVLEACRLDLAQLSGDESPEFCALLGDRALKAFHGVPDQGVEAFARLCAPAFLVDGGKRGSYGGTGVPADWAAAAKLAKRYPLLLAGGLTPDNVSEAVEQVRPWGVDVASGVESRPGAKDPGLVKEFVQAVRSVELERS